MPQANTSDGDALARFYDETYSVDAGSADRYARWRALGAVGKADHVIALCERAGLAPRGTLDVGCGDGALLCELRGRGFGGRLCGAELSAAAVAIARRRPQIDAVARFDGARLDEADGAFELGIVSHVLEHVLDPAALLGEVARVCEAVVFEVPLEANVSARRAGKREHASEVGHLQRLDRGAAREIAARAGLSIVAELDDALPASVHRFFAKTARSRWLATAKWALRASVHRAAPSVARRLFTLHYACLCTRERGAAGG